MTANQTEIIYDNDCFAAMEDLVARAQKSVYLDFYIFNGPTADRIADLLIEKHKAGLDVRVLLCPRLGTLPELRKAGKRIFNKLRAAGVPIAFHNRLSVEPGKPRSFAHNKIVVVDRKEALAGSMNVAPKFYVYHDLLVRLKGGAAGVLADNFLFDYGYAVNRRLPRPPVERSTFLPRYRRPPTPGQPSLVRVVGTGLGRQSGRATLLRALDEAKTSIQIEINEFCDQRVIDALVRAKNRGVNVQALLDPNIIDSFLPGGLKMPRSMLTASAVDALTAAGIEVRSFLTNPKQVISHMKLALIDKELLHVGSMNYTPGGLDWVTETNLVILGGRAVQQASETFEREWTSQSEPVQPIAPLSRVVNFFFRHIGA